MIFLRFQCSFCETSHELSPCGLDNAAQLMGPAALPPGWRLYTVQTPDRVLPPEHDNMAEALHEAYGSAPSAGVMAPMVAQLEQYKVPLSVTLLVCAECVRARSLEDIERRLDEVRDEREGRAGTTQANTPAPVAWPLREVVESTYDLEDEGSPAPVAWPLREVVESTYDLEDEGSPADDDIPY